MIVKRLRGSMKGNREDIGDGQTLEQRIRMDSDSFHVIDEDDEELSFQQIPVDQLTSQTSAGIMI